MTALTWGGAWKKLFKAHNQVTAIFFLKNEILKHANFASEWRESRFRGLEISKCFWGGSDQTHSSENLDPR